MARKYKRKKRTWAWISAARRATTIHLAHALCFMTNHSEGLRPSDSPTRALARRYDGSLRDAWLARDVVIGACRFLKQKGYV